MCILDYDVDLFFTHTGTPASEQEVAALWIWSSSKYDYFIWNGLDVIIPAMHPVSKVIISIA